MKNDYLLFAGHCYYPAGGADDFRVRGTLDELKEWFAEHSQEISDHSYINNWGQIVDPETMKVLLVGQQRHGQEMGIPGKVSWSTAVSG